MFFLSDDSILTLSSGLGLHSKFIKYLDLESHRFDTQHKGRRNFLLYSTGSGGRVCKSSTTIWCVIANTEKCQEFTGTLVLVWDEVEGASLWLHGMMEHITHKTANHNV